MLFGSQNLLLVKGKYEIFNLPMTVEFKFDFDKFLAVLEYLASKGVPELSKYKICKLMFLADKYHLVRYGRPIIGDRYCALPYGPVPSMSLNYINAFLKSSKSDEPESDPKILKMRDSFELDTKYLNPRLQSRRPPS